MKISISTPSKVIVVDGVALTIDDWSTVEIPSGIKVIQMDSDVGGHIEWEDSYLPNLPITYDQFTKVFYHAMAIYDNTKIKVLEAQAEIERERQKQIAADILESQKQAMELASLKFTVNKLADAAGIPKEEREPI